MRCASSSVRLSFVWPNNDIKGFLCRLSSILPGRPFFFGVECGHWAHPGPPWHFFLHGEGLPLAIFCLFRTCFLRLNSATPALTPPPQDLYYRKRLLFAAPNFDPLIDLPHRFLPRSFGSYSHLPRGRPVLKALPATTFGLPSYLTSF